MTKYTREWWLAWLEAAGVRALKTMGQSLAACLATCLMVQDVDWLVVLGTAALAALLSLATSLGGLPELETPGADALPSEDDAG